MASLHGTRLGRLYILSLCLVSFIRRGSARKRPKEIGSILIAPSGKLGDVVCAAPMFTAVRKAYPKARLVLFGNASAAGILADAGLYDEWLDDGQGFAQSLAQIRKGGFDVACLNGSSFPVLALFYLAGIPLISAPYISGSDPIQQTLPYRLLCRLVSVEHFRQGEYVPRLYLTLLRCIGIISDDIEKKLGCTAAAREVALGFYAGAGVRIGHEHVIGITAFAGNRMKEWSAENFSALIRRIHERYRPKIMLFGGPSDKDAARALLSLVPDIPVVDAVGRFDLDGLKAAISLLSMFIGVDTGPVYVAEGFKVPTIDIVGAVAETEQPPRGPYHKTVSLPGRLPAMHVLDARNYDRGEARRQIEGITPDMVMDAFAELWGTDPIRGCLDNG